LGLVGRPGGLRVHLVLGADDDEGLVDVHIGGWVLLLDCVELCLTILGAFEERVIPIKESEVHN
jgi:hypothetical protein